MRAGPACTARLQRLGRVGVGKGSGVVGTPASGVGRGEAGNCSAAWRQERLSVMPGEEASAAAGSPTEPENWPSFGCWAAAELLLLPGALPAPTPGSAAVAGALLVSSFVPRVVCCAAARVVGPPAKTPPD
ncbi:hypothetical protein GCM10028821_01870 [Hymenobacter jeollabukensis]